MAALISVVVLLSLAAAAVLVWLAWRDHLNHYWDDERREAEKHPHGGEG